MTSSLRFALSASAVLAAALLVVGCAPSPGSPASTSAPEPDQSQTPAAPEIGDDMEAAWLDNGRMFAVVTWGSSTCVPSIETATAQGQTVTVELSEGEDDQACTADLAPRASLGALPEGVDPTKDVELIVTLGDVTDDVDLDGNAAFTPSAQGTGSSAGWFDDDSLVLLTWGSSTCLPIVESVETSGRTATVTFTEKERVCTMDMGPRANVITVGETDDDAADDADDADDDAEDAGAFELILVGDNLDATIPVFEG